MGQIWEALTDSGIVTAAAVLVVAVVGYYARPKERRLRKLERLAAVRSQLGDAAGELDEEIDRLIGHVTEDLEREEYRISRTFRFILGVVVTLGSLYWLIPSIWMDLDAVEAATGLRSRAFGVAFGAAMAGAGVGVILEAARFPWIREQLRTESRKLKREQAARAEEVAGRGNEPGATVDL